MQKKTVLRKFQRTGSSIGIQSNSLLRSRLRVRVPPGAVLQTASGAEPKGFRRRTDSSTAEPPAFNRRVAGSNPARCMRERETAKGSDFGPVAQSAEARDRESRCCRFDSCSEH